MSDDAGRPSGHTLWRRLALVMVPTMVVSVVLLALVTVGVLPAAVAISAHSLVISGQNFKISADRLDGRDFTQYVVADRSKSTAYPEGLSAIRSADLHNLC